ncbi:Tim44/TimA family putative adaptor protein [Sphingomonas carotinifaciens]|uniref:Tim44-like domain-containing protein n=1 Tax=Sphingomonas carotinifaciens TaxID=1166323 RepID=A0A1G7EVP2_9SPHN|nr:MULTISPECIES: Tim44/TimA family putative adaptor protein [Sphingomonas]MBB4085764.1 putative lipid-binding transport protein (Tim44 family) [Sphingomonas carotinifaciens]MWC45156.1 Tim44/TimA family putative adaptor protein [Sphingomonas carotinifaciens]SDE67647.1 Tim44-like domain-containing protein [Sphingomonas carotinifaciens]
MFYVVLLAMVALFLALRLYSVLGKRTGHEQQPLARGADDRGVPVTVARPVEVSLEKREMPNRNIEGRAEQGVRAVIAAEPGFDVAQFLNGAQSAYRMTLESFWKGDEEALATLAEPDVQAVFAEAIAARRESGETLDNRLVSIERAVITDAQVQGREARITVRFDADIAAVTRDASGQVVAGSLTDAVETHDVWTFARTLKSSDPNWKLADTDEA